MKDVFEQVVISVLAALAVGVIGWFFCPYRNELETKRVRATGDHGLKLSVLSRPSDLVGVAPDEVLGVTRRGSSGRATTSAPGPPDEPPPADPAFWMDWAERNGAVSIYHTHVMLRVQATQARR